MRSLLVKEVVKAINEQERKVAMREEKREIGSMDCG